jgi:hypothetical protein
MKQCYRHIEMLNQYGYNTYSVSMPANTTTLADESSRIELNKAIGLYEPERDYIFAFRRLSDLDRNEIIFDWPGTKILFGVEVSPEIIMGTLGNAARIFTLSESTRTLLSLANPALSVFQIEYSYNLNHPPNTEPGHKDCIIAILGTFSIALETLDY